MPGSWYTVAAGQTINAADVNQFSNALHQPVGQIEISPIYVSLGTDATGRAIGNWIVTLNHQNAPATVTWTSVTTNNVGTPSTNSLNAGGFMGVAFSNNGAQNNCNFAATYNATY